MVEKVRMCGLSAAKESFIGADKLFLERFKAFH